MCSPLRLTNYESIFKNLTEKFYALLFSFFPELFEVPSGCHIDTVISDLVSYQRSQLQTLPILLSCLLLNILTYFYV